MKAKYILFIILTTLLLYVIAKERVEHGCSGSFSVKPHCNDMEHIYVKNTIPESNDSCKDIFSKLESLVSFSEKGAVWRRSMIVSFFCCLIVYFVYNINKKLEIQHYNILFLLLFTIIYFYHNYIDYHYFRHIKNNGIKISKTLEEKCCK